MVLGDIIPRPLPPTPQAAWFSMQRKVKDAPFVPLGTLALVVGVCGGWGLQEHVVRLPLSEALLEGSKPILVFSALRPTIVLPKEIGRIANRLREDRVNPRIVV